MNVVWLEASGWGAFHRSNPGGNQEPLLHLTTEMEPCGRRLELPSDVQLYCFYLELNYCSMFISSVPTTTLFQRHKKVACHIPSLQSIFRPLDVVRSLTGPSNSPYGWKNKDINVSAEFEQLVCGFITQNYTKLQKGAQYIRDFIISTLTDRHIVYSQKSCYQMLDAKWTFWLRKGQINIPYKTKFIKCVYIFS